MTKWVTKKLGDDSVAKIIMGQSPSSASYNEEFEGLPFLQGCAEFGKINPNTHIYCNEPLKVAPENSILMSVRAPVGTMNRADQKYIIGRGLCAIVPVIDGDYLYYYLSQNTHLLEQRAQGSTFLAVNTTEVSDMPITYPESLAEQRRIAGILSSADGAIAASEALIEKYRNIKRGLLATLLQPKEGWKKVKLGECAQINRGGSPRPIDAFVTDSEDGINWIKIGDIAPNGKYVNTTSEKIIPEGKQHSREVLKGDFILSNSMSFGRPYILNIEGCIHDGWLAIQDYEETFDTDFLYYMLSSDIVKKQYLAMASGSTVLNLNKEKVAKVILTIPFTSEGTPDLMEQKHIASILSSIDAKINIEEDVVEKYKGVKKGLMEELLKSNL